MKRSQKNTSVLSKEKLKRQKASLVKLGIMLVFSVIVFIFSSIAWFSSNKEVDSSGMSIRALNDLV